MPTIAKGNQLELYVPTDSSMAFTPGVGGSVQFDCSSPVGATRPAARTIYSATTVPIPGGSTVFARAVVGDATYSQSPASGARSKIRVNGYIHTRKQVNSGVTAPISAGYTINNACTAEGPFRAARVVIQQGSGGSTSGVKACFAPTADISTDTRRRDPVDALGAAVSFSVLGFNDAGIPVRFPPSASGAAGASGTIAAGSGSGSQLVEANYFSDWAWVTSLPRTDIAGELPAFIYRTYYPNAGAYGSNPGGAMAVWSAENSTYALGRRIDSHIQVADGVGAPGSMTGAGGAGWVGAAAIQLLMHNRGLSVHAVGDSTFAGQGSQNLNTNAPFATWGHYGCASVSRQTRPVTFANWGCSGQHSQATQTRARSILSLFNPDVIVINGFSLNNAGSSIPASVGINYANEIIARAAHQNCVTVLMTQTPGSLSGQTETDRQAWNATARAICAAGDAYLFDADLTVRDPANLTQMLTIMKIDNWHYNDTGYAALGATFSAVLTQILLDQGLAL